MDCFIVTFNVIISLFWFSRLVIDFLIVKVKISAVIFKIVFICNGLVIVATYVTEMK